MKYRHELKHEINLLDKMMLQNRLNAIMKSDQHCIDGKYKIRSLYFDDINDKALREKINGVNEREKFRIRYYNGDFSFISLEKKSKKNNLCNKVSCYITYEETQKIIIGDIEWMKTSDRVLVRELYAKMTSGTLKPKTIVDYTRIPFVYGPGNVRVTIDYDIRTALTCKDFLNWNSITFPSGLSPIILEVKWDEFLPDIIRDACNLKGRRESAFSKYAACRIYG